MEERKTIPRNEQGYPLLPNGEIDWELTSKEKSEVEEQFNRAAYGVSRKPKRKHATNYTPPKKRNRKK